MSRCRPDEYPPYPPAPHEWQRGRFTGALTCSRCHLLPLDADDIETPCTPEDPNE